MRHPGRNLDFYKEQYMFEYDRTKFLDSSLRFPTTLLIGLLGGAFYFYNKCFENGVIVLCSLIDYIMLILFILFSILIVITGFFLSRVYYGFHRKYDFLPISLELFKHERDLYKHHYKYEEGSYYERRKNSMELSANDFKKEIETYYVEMASNNQAVNDSRSNNYYFTRMFLFIQFVLLTLIGIISFTFY